MADSAAQAQQAVLRKILKARAGCSLFRQLGLQRLAGFKDFDTLYAGFSRAVPVQGARVFLDSLAKMQPQGGLTPLQVLQSPNLLLRDKPLAACLWKGVPLPVQRDALRDHLVVERYLKRLLGMQGVKLSGKVFYLFEQEASLSEGGETMAVPLAGWHQLLEGQRWFWERERVKPATKGLPRSGSRWQWFNAMLDQLRLAGGEVDMLVTHPKTLIDFGLYVSQQAGRYVPLREFLPHLRVLALNHYDIGVQRMELGYLLSGLPQVRWVQWLYNPTGLQAWQGDVNIRQRLDMLVDGQVFYEFIPVEDMDLAGRFARSFRRLHTGQVEAGREYVLAVSSLSGLLGVASGMVVKVVSLDPFQIVAKGPVGQLHGLNEGLREDMVVEAIGNINSALSGQGVFVREVLMGHLVAERAPVWVL
ncbi:MAG: hypothetical protein GC129_05470, partial [Proteobacteria bacterium]|nr:hypothetical protein [Pseudomonadota bacterium]